MNEGTADYIRHILLQASKEYGTPWPKKIGMKETELPYFRKKKQSRRSIADILFYNSLYSSDDVLD